MMCLSVLREMPEPITRFIISLLPRSSPRVCAIFNATAIAFYFSRVALSTTGMFLCL